MKNTHLILRSMLFLVALTGILSGVALLLPWSTTVDWLKRLEIHGVPASLPAPIIEYWLMMMAAACAVIGYLYLVAALKLEKYRIILPFLGWSLLFIGVTAGYHGVRLGIPPWPFYADMLICAVCGSGIVWCAKKV